ncbi:putative leucine-rich repeat receptor-like serine/threonine-protein kinase [Nymphaea thermarum]|nr:putative leucine-rich repeat receptor-like serine/threonine-protein kinase [Nymphaea thermarum]
MRINKKLGSQSIEWITARISNWECNDKPKVVLLEPEIKHGFPYAEIVKITNNFEKVIGEGGSGNLYYGRLKNGHELAVKVLKNSLSQGTKELLAKLILGEVNQFTTNA